MIVLILILIFLIVLYTKVKTYEFFYQDVKTFLKNNFIDDKINILDKRSDNPLNQNFNVNGNIMAKKYCISKKYPNSNVSNNYCLNIEDVNQLRNKIPFYKDSVCIGDVCLTEEDIKPLSGKSGGANFTKNVVVDGNVSNFKSVEASRTNIDKNMWLQGESLNENNSKILTGTKTIKLADGDGGGDWPQIKLKNHWLHDSRQNANAYTRTNGEGNDFLLKTINENLNVNETRFQPVDGRCLRINGSGQVECHSYTGDHWFNRDRYQLTNKGLSDHRTANMIHGCVNYLNPRFVNESKRGHPKRSDNEKNAYYYYDDCRLANNIAKNFDMKNINGLGDAYLNNDFFNYNAKGQNRHFNHHASSENRAIHSKFGLKTNSDADLYNLRHYRNLIKKNNQIDMKIPNFRNPENHLAGSAKPINPNRRYSALYGKTVAQPMIKGPRRFNNNINHWSAARKKRGFFYA